MIASLIKTLENQYLRLCLKMRNNQKSLRYDYRNSDYHLPYLTQQPVLRRKPLAEFDMDFAKLSLCDGARRV